MPQSILFLLFGDLGDTILTVPAIRAVRTRYPEATLVFVTKALPASLVEALGLADETIIVDKHVFDRTSSLLRPRALVSVLRLLLLMRRRRADSVVLFHHLVTRWGAFKFALLALASGSRRRIGLDNGRGWFLTESIRDKGFGDRHEAQYWLDVATLLDAHGTLSLEFPVSAGDRQRARDLVDGPAGGRRILALHPGTGWYGPGRRWDPSRFARVAEIVLGREDMLCVVVGTLEEMAEINVVTSLLGDRALNLVGKTSVGELAAVLERCSVLVANDGGVAHVAAAVGIPVVAVFGPSNDRAWRPLTGRVVAVDLPCRPCFYRDFERGNPAGYGDRECLTQVNPRLVAAAVFSLLQEGAVAV